MLDVLDHVYTSNKESEFLSFDAHFLRLLERLLPFSWSRGWKSTCRPTLLISMFVYYVLGLLKKSFFFCLPVKEGLIWGSILIVYGKCIGYKSSAFGVWHNGCVERTAYWTPRWHPFITKSFLLSPAPYIDKVITWHLTLTNSFSSPPLWSRLKYLRNWMNCDASYFRPSYFPQDELQ